MKNYLSVSMMLVLTIPSFAQFKNPSKEKSASFIAKKTLYVQDFFENEEQREWFKKYWKFNHEIKFVKSEEIKAAVDQKKSDIAIFTGGDRDEVMESNDMKTSFDAFIMCTYIADDVKGWNDKKVDTRKKREIFKLSTTTAPYNEADFKLIGEHFYNYMSRADGNNADNMSDKLDLQDESIAKLTKKVMLVPKEATKMTEEEIKEVYPYAFKLVDAGYISNSILTSNKDEAYISLLFSDNGFSWAVFVISTMDSEILNKVGTGGISFGFYIPNGIGGKSATHKVKPFELKKSHFKPMAGRVKRNAD